MAEEAIEDSVDAYFDIEIVDATDFKINCRAKVNKITLPDSGTYTYDQIEGFSTSNPILLGAICYRLRILINDTVSSILTNSYVKPTNDLPNYRSGLFYDNFSIGLTNLHFNISEDANISELLNGILDMGGQIEYNFNFKARTGWDNTYSLNLGTNFDFQETDGLVKGNTIIEWKVLNRLSGETSKRGKAIIKDKTPTTQEKEENIFLNFLIDCYTQNTTLEISTLLNSIEIKRYGVLPKLIKNLDYIPSDGIRLFVANKLISWDDVYQKTVKPIEEKIKSAVENSSFNQTLDLIFDWDVETATNCSDPYETDKIDREPAVKGLLKDYDVKFMIFNISSRCVFGLINAGAKASVEGGDINFGENLRTIGYPYSISLKLPEGVMLDGKNMYSWNDSIPLKGNFGSTKAPSYSEEDINTIVEIEVKNTDLNLLSLLTGKTELIFGLSLLESRNYNVTKLPSQFSLPNKITLEYLNSDAFRLCVEERVFDEEEIDRFLENEKVNFENRMKTIITNLELIASIDKDIFKESLNWDGDIGNMDDDKPIITSSYAYTNYPVKFDLSLFLPNFQIPTQVYHFSGIEGQYVTYRIIFPKGVSLDVSDSLGKAIVRSTNDERQYIEVNFSPSEGNITLDVFCDVKPSIPFILIILLPCFIALFIVILLIAVLIIIRRKKRGRKLPVEEEVSPYEGEEYYVPPPPDTK